MRSLVPFRLHFQPFFKILRDVSFFAILRTPVLTFLQQRYRLIAFRVCNISLLHFNMKFYLNSLLVTVLCCVAMVHAETKTVWANGVSAEGGWYDVNKSDSTIDDDMMCYAASAANLLAWWQDSLTRVPVGTPGTADEIWSTMQGAAVNGAVNGGNAAHAMAWWLTGVYVPTTTEEAERWAVPNISLGNSEFVNKENGYYSEVCNLTSTQVYDFCGYSIAGNMLYPYTYGKDVISTLNFAALFEAGYGISLGVKSNTNNGHAITLWGVEYEGNALTKLWLTDSDDYKINYGGDRLFAADVEEKDGMVYFSTETVSWQDADNPNITPSTTQYKKEDGYYIDSVTLLNPKAFTVVPEPATVTLSLLGLAGLVARRRRPGCV